MLVLYAIVAADAPEPAVRGIVGTELAVLRGHRSALVVEEAPSAPALTRETALAFADVVGQIAAVTTAMPVRFPSTVPTVDAARRELEQRDDAWAERLHELAGLAEVSVRAHWDDLDEAPGPDPPESGSDFLHRLAAQARRSEARVTEIEQLVAPWSQATRRLSAADGVRLACLVARGDLDALHDAARRWQDESAERHADLAGPWPPFSFVDRHPGAVA